MELQNKELVSFDVTSPAQEAISTTLNIVNSKKRFQSFAKGRDVSSVFKIGCDAASVAQSSGNFSRHATKAFNESGDDLEALGSGIKHQMQSEMCHEITLMGESINPNTEETAVNQENVSELIQNSLIEQSSITIQDFVPVDIVTSVLSQLFKDRFPKPKDQTRKFICRWCKPDRAKINRYSYSSIHHLLQHYLIKHKEIPVKDYGIQCNNCQAYFFHKQRHDMHIAKSECHEHNIQKNYDYRHGWSRILTMDAFMKVCSFCDMVFLSMKRFQKHLHNNVDACRFETIDHPMELGMFDYMKCKFCDAKFLFEDDFQFHVNPWSNKEYLKNSGTFKCKSISRPVFTCKVCLQKYHNATSHGEHILMDHNIEEFEICCDRCEKHFYLESELIVHRENMKNYPTCIDFEACRTIPRRIDKNLEARRIISKIQCFKCPVCSQIISWGRAQFSQHIRSSHPNYNTEWKCCDCEKTFITVAEYEDHVTKWKCPFCVETTIFSMKRQLVNHCWQKHTVIQENDIVFICDICNSNFKAAHSLAKHKRTAHNGLKECPFCGVTDNIIKDMYRHVNLYHAVNENIFPCNLCKNTVSFREKAALARHIKEVHEKAVKTECDICHRTFAQKATMLRHRRIHLDIKPFKCDICEFSFTQNNGMKAHRARHYNKDGTLKSQEEIQVQVENLKQQRETLKVAPTKDLKDQKKWSRKKEKIPCETCGVQFTSKAKFEFHPCKQESYEEPSEEEVCEPSDTDDYNEIDAPEYNFHCDVCDQTFVSAERLGTHRCRKKVKRSYHGTGSDCDHGTGSDCDDYQKYTTKQPQIKESTNTKLGGIMKKGKAERGKNKQRRTKQQTATNRKQSLSKTRTENKITRKKLQRSGCKHKQTNTRLSLKSKIVFSSTSARNMQKHNESLERYPLRRRQQDVAANSNLSKANLMPI